MRPISIGDRVRIIRVVAPHLRRHQGETGTVSDVVSVTGPMASTVYVVLTSSGTYVRAVEVDRLEENSARFAPSALRTAQIIPQADAVNVTALDPIRVQAVGAAKQILGDVTVSEITELAAFLAKQTDSVAPATPSATAVARDTAAEMETARRIVRGGHSCASGISVRMDETDDDDVAEVSGYYLKPTEVRDLIAFLGAALLVHEAKRDTPF